jgi:hypothetical protein
MSAGQYVVQLRYFMHIALSKINPSVEELLHLTLTVVLIMLVYAGLDYLFINGTRLDESTYSSPFIALELITRAWTRPYITSLVSILLLLGGWYFRDIWRDWCFLEHGRQIRSFTTLTAAVLAWRFCTYDYNFYFGQAHLPDRLLLIALVGLIWWRPVFVFPFVFLLCALIWQFTMPLGGYSWAQQYMPLRLIILFAATLLLSAISGRRFGNQYVFLACCLVMSHYWVPGVGKLAIDWISQGHVYNLLPSTYANGWLGFLGPERLSDIAVIIARLDPLILFLTLFFQLCAIVALWRRQLLITLLLIYPLFHLAIFSLSGIFFWQWIIVEAGLIVLLSRLWPAEGEPVNDIFTGQYFILSVILIGGSSIWFKPVNLAWYDTNMSYTTRFEATGESGTRYSLSPDFFAPYQYPFTLSDFSYLVDRPHLGMVWGSSHNVAIVEALRSAKSLSDVRKIEAALGRNRFNPVKAERFDDFIHRFTTKVNKRSDRAVLPGWLGAPPQLWTFSPDNAYEGQEKISEISIYLVTSLFSDGRYAEIDKTFLRAIQVNAAGSSKP